MRCSTCGENVRAGEDRCPICGSVIEIRRTPAVAGRRDVGFGREVRQCPRCAHHSEGVPYFRKGGNLALLVGLSVFTYGIGGLVYYAGCRDRRVCPSCGLGWEHSRESAGALQRAESAGVPERHAAVPAPAPAPVRPPPPRRRIPGGGIGRRIVGAGMGVMATLMTTMGIAQAAPGQALFGLMMGAAGGGIFLWGWKALQRRRQSLLQALNHKVLMLAGSTGGVLTVTEVAAELDLSLEAAEKLMMSMDDDFRVRSVISDEGVIYYEFPEVIHQKKLRAGA